MSRRRPARRPPRYARGDEDGAERAWDFAAELRRQLDAREQRIDSLQAELRVLAAGNPAVLEVLDRLGIRLEPEA
jgi:hypothetical protein